MKIGFVGLGAVVQTAYLPALAALAENTEIWGFDPAITLPGVMSAPTLEALLAEPLDRLVIATPSLLHLPVLEQALASAIPLILVEKPVVATLAQHDRLHALLADPEVAARVLALDHWMARNAVQQLLLSGKLDEGWQPREPEGAGVGLATLADISAVEGFLLEPCGLDEAGEPYALNFATGEPDRRVLRHPDGVILDIGTHLLAMIRELLVALGGDDRLHLIADGVCDRLGQPIRRGDLETAEGRACLRGEAAGVPLTLWLDKYAGPGVEKKGLCLHLKDGRRIELLRRATWSGCTITTSTGCGAGNMRAPLSPLHRPDSAGPRAFGRLGRHHARRLQEVALLLELQQGLRGPH
ncbi:Gfo/Idh/MocA family oxidoreductase [Aeromonas caviae]